jgi:2-phospho-L-lactate guanylyltransferase
VHTRVHGVEESRAFRTGWIYSAGVSITAIVPLKALARSKQRLADHLADTERRALVASLFTHVVQVCATAPQVDDVCAVVGDDAGADLARSAGVLYVREPAAGLNGAVAHATARVRTTASLVVVADLPQLSVSDIGQVVAAGGGGDPVVVVARTHDGGTGALLRRPAAVIAPAFGPASATRHLAAAQRGHVRAVLLSPPGLRHDVDRADDLDRYAGAAGGHRHPPHR